MLEKQLEDDQRLQAQLAAKAAADKKHLIEFVAKDQVKTRDVLLSVWRYGPAAIGHCVFHFTRNLIHFLAAESAGWGTGCDTESERPGKELIGQCLARG